MSRLWLTVEYNEKYVFLFIRARIESGKRIGSAPWGKLCTGMRDRDGER